MGIEPKGYVSVRRRHKIALVKPPPNRTDVPPMFILVLQRAM